MAHTSYAEVRELARRLPRQEQAALISELATALATATESHAAPHLADPAQRAAALAELRAAFAAAPVRAADQLAADRQARQDVLEGRGRADA